MKKVKQILIVALLLVFSQVSFAQDFQVPKNYSFKKKEDFAKYEKDVISCTQWLENTPLNQEAPKRKEANAFLLSWVSGAPNVSVEINQKIVNFSEKNPDLLMIFIGGWTRSSLETPANDKDKVKGNLAGVRSVIKFYKANLDKGIKKDKNVEALVKLEDDGKLEAWVKENLQ
jgi:hypothetical protein